MINFKKLVCTLSIASALVISSGCVANSENEKQTINMAKKEFASTQTKIDFKEIERSIREKYPATTINSFSKSPIDGLYEIQMGKNVAYTDEEGRYFLFGHVYDMNTQTDLTAETYGTGTNESAEASTNGSDEESAKFPKEFLDQAIMTKKGTGEKSIAIFTDPDCGYCQKLEEELVGLDDITIYRFIIPMLGNKSESISIWCAENPEEAFLNKMTGDGTVKMASCNNPIQKNLDLAKKMGIKGTPFMIKPDDGNKYGYVELSELNKWVSQ